MRRGQSKIFYTILWALVSLPTFLGAAKNIAELQEALSKDGFRLQPFRLVDLKDLPGHIDTKLLQLEEIAASIPQLQDPVETLRAFDALFFHFGHLVSQTTSLRHYRYSHAKPEVLHRETQRLQDWWNQRILKDESLQAVLIRMEKDSNSLGGLDKRALEKIQSQIPTPTGSSLSSSPEERIQEQQQSLIYRTLDRLEEEFLSNHGESIAPVQFKVEELEGLPPKFFESAQKNGELIELKADDWLHYYYVMTYARSSRTRKKMLEARSQLANHVNRPLAFQIAHYRQLAASLEGYKSWADFRLGDYSVKNATQLQEFLERALELNKASFQREKRIVQEEKARHLHKKNAKASEQDWRFYLEQYGQREFQVDPEEMREFFPLAALVEKSFELIGEIFQVEFEEIEDPSRWHESVRSFYVRDIKTGRPLGLIYLDLFPREGKDQWFFVSSHSSHRKTANGVDLPTISMLANFEAELPARDIWSWLHELGHLVHYISSDTPYSVLAEEEIDADLVEVISSFFELYSFDHDFIQRLSFHPEKKRSLTKDEASRLIAYLRLGTAHSRQAKIADALIDFEIHGSGRSVSAEEEIEKKIYQRAYYPLSSRASFLSQFTHLVGYDATMFSYVLGFVAAAEIKAEFDRSEKGLFDKNTARRVLEEFLSKAGSQSTEEIMSGLLRKKTYQPCRFNISRLKKAEHLQ